MYRALFSRRAEKAFLDLPTNLARRVKQAVDTLTDEPRAHGTIKLDSAPVAQYRYRVGDCRILFDIDDDSQVLEIVDIRKRDDQTYK